MVKGNEGNVLVGVKRIVSKKGEPFSILQLTVPFSQRELDAGCTGVKIQEQFVPSELAAKADLLVIGRPVAFDYEVSGNRAYVVGFSSVNEK